MKTAIVIFAENPTKPTYFKDISKIGIEGGFLHITAHNGAVKYIFELVNILSFMAEE